MKNGNYADEDKEKIGEAIAEIFCLRKVKRNPPLYKTAWGNKYDRGIFEIVSRLGNEIKEGTIEKTLF